MRARRRSSTHTIYEDYEEGGKRGVGIGHNYHRGYATFFLIARAIFFPWCVLFTVKEYRFYTSR